MNTLHMPIGIPHPTTSGIATVNLRLAESNYAQLRAATVRDLIATTQRLEALEYAATVDTPSQWGDLTPARVLLEAREQELQEQLAVMDVHLQHARRTHARISQPPAFWKCLAAVAALVGTVTAFLLHAAGVLVP